MIRGDRQHKHYSIESEKNTDIRWTSQRLGTKASLELRRIHRVLVTEKILELAKSNPEGLNQLC